MTEHTENNLPAARRHLGPQPCLACEARRVELLPDLSVGSLIIARSSIFETTTTRRSITFVGSKHANSRDHDITRAKMAIPLGLVRDRSTDLDREARSWENRQVRIHGAELGARSAIQSGSDHDRSTAKPHKGIR